MARLPRLTLPDHVHHVVQRGNNGQPIFTQLEDYRQMLELLAACSHSQQVAVHAYLLLEDQFHLLLTPQTADGVPAMMQSIGRGYVRYFNSAHRRTGTLWEGRYRGTVLQAERYLLPTMCVMDNLPVLKERCAGPLDYPWSSHAHYVGARQDKIVTPHMAYWALGNTPFAREEAYSLRVHAGVSQAQSQEILDAAIKGWPLGDADFKRALEQTTGRRVEKARVGRPLSK